MTTTIRPEFALDRRGAELRPFPPITCLPGIFFFNDTATTEIYTLSLHDALPILSRYPSSAPLSAVVGARANDPGRLRGMGDRKSTRLNSSHITISYAVFCLK